MESLRLDPFKNWYLDYTARYQTGGQFLPKQQIKREHSLRVADEAEGLAKEMGWDERDIDLAYVIGLLHDIGRFSQFAEFGTLVDHQSVNHAERGVEVLSRENILAGFDGATRAVILDAVRWHNCKVIPPGCSSESRCYVELIRDADKLDGFWIMHQALEVRTSKIYDDLFVGKSMTDPSTPALAEAVKQKQMISYPDVRSVADYLLLQIGWIYDINYAAAMKRVRDRSVIESICRYLPQDPGIREAAKTAIEFRDEFLRGR